MYCQSNSQASSGCCQALEVILTLLCHYTSHSTLSHYVTLLLQKRLGLRQHVRCLWHACRLLGPSKVHYATGQEQGCRLTRCCVCEGAMGSAYAASQEVTLIPVENSHSYAQKQRRDPAHCSWMGQALLALSTWDHRTLGKAVMAFLITMACLGIPEGASRSPQLL